MNTIRNTIRRGLKGQKGVTLVELLIALAIGGILIGLTFQFLNVESENFLQGRNNSEMQQELRWAMQFVSAHVRLAGNIVPQMLIADTGYKVIDNINGPGGAPDSLSILGSFRSVVITLDQTMGNVGAQIKCSDKANFPPEALVDILSDFDLAFISDGTYSEVFQITKILADHLYHEASPPLERRQQAGPPVRHRQHAHRDHQLQLLCPGGLHGALESHGQIPGLAGTDTGR